MCTDTLQANRDLLDPHFDGYKLSLDPLPKYSVDVECGIDEVKLRSDQYTLQHVKAFGIHNHLVHDQWNPNCVFYIDKRWRVVQHRVVLESQLQPGRVVFEISHECEQRSRPRHNATLHFTSAELCLLADGAGALYLLATGDRDCADLSTWQILYSEEVCSPATPFVLLHSIAQAKSASFDCLLLRIEEEQTEKTGDDPNDAVTTSGHFTALLDWLTIAKADGESSHRVSRRRRLKSKLAPFYAAIEATGQAVFLAGEAEFTITEDTAKTTTGVQEQDMDVEKDSDTSTEAAPLYTWTQTGDDVTLVFILPPSTPKSAVNLTLTADTINLGIKDGDELLKGALYRAIDVQMCTWIHENRKLEVTLAKAEEGSMWTEVVIGNQRGDYVIDQDQARIIHERLAHLTSDQLHPDPVPGGSQPGIGPNDLEECDALSDGYSTLVRLDRESHTVTNRVSLSSHQVLFNAQLHPQRPPCICLRHDVDGLLWQPGIGADGDHRSPWQHTATFNALGYVQASKRDRKYSCCPPDCSYALVCDCVRHLYVYRQPSAILSPLRNRKSGRVVSQIAKQQLVSLETTDDILGVAAADDRLFVLTNNQLCVIRVAQQ
ncbi:nudC domain-containing protein 1-like isoform X2 [Patiria miniata]|uniref:NudC domain-containing protein 1 n=1 Tax=Patiria miniata TaxID=46514 RepID=A0A914AYP4_PATMI|nr:nudC domain-containing protein 1-like isoform X2 [Patiria miniata]